jgi:hypothetical protein
MLNNQLKDFNNYYMKQLSQKENLSYYEEPKEEDIEKEKEKNTAKNLDKIEAKTLILKESASKRISSLPKRYQTYTLDYKKQVIEEVNILLLLIIF